MAQYVDKVDYEHIEGCGGKLLYLRQQLAHGLRVVEFVVGKLLATAEAFELMGYQCLLVKVLPSSSSSSTHRSGYICFICSGMSPANMALRAYCVAVGSMV